MSISLQWREVGKVMVVDISGRSSVVDGSIVQQTARRLMNEGNRQFVFNLSNLIHFDSFGMGQLISTYMTVREQGGDVKLVNPSPDLRRLLRNTRLDTVLEIFDNEADAVRALQGIPSHPKDSA